MKLPLVKRVYVNFACFGSSLTQLTLTFNVVAAAAAAAAKIFSSSDYVGARKLASASHTHSL